MYMKSKIKRKRGRAGRRGAGRGAGARQRPAARGEWSEVRGGWRWSVLPAITNMLGTTTTISPKPPQQQRYRIFLTVSNMANAIRWQHAILLLTCVLFTSRLQMVASDDKVELPKADADLFAALSDEDVDAANAALKAGANINSKSPRGAQTPLMQSVLHGRTKMVEWCLENGADVTIGERDGYTPMHGA